MREQLKKALSFPPTDPAVDRILATTFFSPRRTTAEVPARVIRFPKSLRSFA